VGGILEFFFFFFFFFEVHACTEVRGGKKYERGARLHPSTDCDSTRAAKNKTKSMYAKCHGRIEAQIVVAVAAAVEGGFGIPNDVGAGGNPAVQDYGHSVSHFLVHPAFCVDGAYRQGQHR